MLQNIMLCWRTYAFQSFIAVGNFYFNVQLTGRRGALIEIFRTMPKKNIEHLRLLTNWICQVKSRGFTRHFLLRCLRHVWVESLLPESNLSKKRRPKKRVFTTYEAVSDHGPVWVRSEDKIPSDFESTPNIIFSMPPYSLVTQLS